MFCYIGVCCVTVSTSAFEAEGPGSNPSTPTIYIELYFSWLECHPDKMEVVGSSPISSTLGISKMIRMKVVNIEN